jgi:V8-like Glu-specific endopeptidase
MQHVQHRAPVALASRPHGAPAAAQVRGAIWRGGGLVARATGRVFFTLDRVRYACSGATVGANVVLTAAHCVSNGSGGWASNWTFVPGYVNGHAPYGVYRARTMYVSSAWASGADPGEDVAFVRVRPAGRPAARAAGRAGSAGELPIAFGLARSQRAVVFGYPAVPPYTGRTLDYCAGPVRADPYGGADHGIACAMTEGDSGGPWLSGFDPRTGTGVITGVTSFKYTGHGRMLYSPILGEMARKLYERAIAPLAAGQASADISRARAKSLPVRPPAECVDRVSVTLSQEIAASGWWPARSAR